MADSQSGLDIPALQRAIARLHIRDVYLRSCKVDIPDDYIPKLSADAPLDVQLKYGPRHAKEMVWTNNQTKAKERVFLVDIFTAVRFVDRGSDNNNPDSVTPKATFEAGFLAEYKIDTDDPIPQQAFEEFAKHNVIYHVWPYWRELIQSLCARTQVPSFTLPMYVLRPKKADEAQSET